VYSPEGRCNDKLEKPPIKNDNAVLVFSNNRIIACDGGGCWEYNPRKNDWVKFIESPFEPLQQHGAVLNDNLYVVDHDNVHILDLKSNTWSTGPKPQKNFGTCPSTVGWKDSIILLGGDGNSKRVQVFNVTSHVWTIQALGNIPFGLDWSSSLLIDQNRVLTAGSYPSPFHHSAAIYYPQNNTWISLPASQVSHRGSRLVKLGSRIFAINGQAKDTVQEFSADNNTWSLIGIQPYNRYNGKHSVVAVPASLFAHLPGGCKGIL